MSNLVCETCWEHALCNDCQDKLIKKRREIKDLCIRGLGTDGGHHKQWFLEEILKVIGVNMEVLKNYDYNLGERGIPP